MEYICNACHLHWIEHAFRDACIGCGSQSITGWDTERYGDEETHEEDVEDDDDDE